MAQYNINDFYPESGREIKSDGTVVNPADSVDTSGNQGVVMNGRATQYQRVMVNQPLAANGNNTLAVGIPSGSKSINIVYRSTGSAQLQIIPVDNSGTVILGGQAFAATVSSGSTSGGLLINDIGGCPYIGLFVADKSAAANTIQFVDIWVSKA